MPRKPSDNVFTLEDARTDRQDTDDQIKPTLRHRWFARAKRIGFYVIGLVIALSIGGLILLQGDNFTQTQNWLNESTNALLFWRAFLYSGAIWFGPRWLLTPDQRTNVTIVRKTRWITFFVALTLEILLVQKGLAGLAIAIQGGF